MTGFQVVVAWQAAQAVLEAIWPAFLPVAVVPLWHEAQPPLTWAWSTCVTGRHENVAWHAPQDVLERMWVALLLVARVPSWHVAQASVSPVCEKLAVGYLGFYEPFTDSEGNMLGLWQNAG